MYEETEMMASLARPSSPLEMLKAKRLHLEAQLANVTTAIEALEKNPEVSKILELLARANIR